VLGVFSFLSLDNLCRAFSTRSAAKETFFSICEAQILNTVNPIFLRCLVLRRSRLIFASILLTQYSILILNAFFNSLYPRVLHSRPCQKSPSTNNAKRNREKTISGLPGKPLTFTRYLNPRLYNSFLNRISGRVSFDGMRFIIRDVTAESRISKSFFGKQNASIPILRCRLAESNAKLSDWHSVVSSTAVCWGLIHRLT
jgi:hypothetical protein